jgi:hypothetical protein
MSAHQNPGDVGIFCFVKPAHNQGHAIVDPTAIDPCKSSHIDDLA